MINRWPYINKYAMAFPAGLEQSFEIGNCSVAYEKDYFIVFLPDTPEELKRRFVKDYAEYHAQKMEEQRRGIYYDD